MARQNADFIHFSHQKKKKKQEEEFTLKMPTLIVFRINYLHEMAESKLKSSNTYFIALALQAFYMCFCRYVHVQTRKIEGGRAKTFL